MTVRESVCLIHLLIDDDSQTTFFFRWALPNRRGEINLRPSEVGTLVEVSPPLSFWKKVTYHLLKNKNSIFCFKRFPYASNTLPSGYKWVFLRDNFVFWSFFIQIIFVNHSS